MQDQGEAKVGEGGFCALTDSRLNVRRDGRGIKVEYIISSSEAKKSGI